MLSKPKSGIYIKNRDRTPRRQTPRSDSEGHYDEVLVESFGAGNISAGNSPEWPQNFEIRQPKSETPSSTSTYPDRAQKYLVDTGSIKDLTGAKFITVPDIKPMHVGSNNEPKQVNRSRSPRNLEHVQRSSHDQSIPSAYVQPMPRSEEAPVQQDYPITKIHAGTLKEGKHKAAAHLATIRLHPLKRPSHLTTVKAVPQSGVRSVRGYHLGYNATVRGHNTGHIVKQVKQSSLSSWDHVDGTHAFRRTTAVPDRKEYCFNRFAIELDRPDRECFTPGELLSGRIILDVNTKVEIRFVELIIVGVSTLNFSDNDPNHEKNAQEVVINKRSYVMGAPDGRWNSVITEGKYVSKFRFLLPKDIPSSIKYENKEHGVSFEIGYLIKARICDELGSSSTRSTHSINTLVKVLLSRKHPFFVRRPFDIHAIPSALKPVNHSEFINLNCLPIALDSSMVTLSLDRSVFLAGDVIRVRLSTSQRTARKIKHLSCHLQQRLTSSIKPKAVYSLVQVEDHEPQGVITQTNLRNSVSFDFMIPTHHQLIPTYLQGCTLLKVSYYIIMAVKFKSCAGKLILEAPIGVGPCIDPQNLDKVNAVPIFNRPIRFPHFSKENGKIQNGMVQPNVRGRDVKSAHRKGGRSCLLCCVDDDV